LQDQDYRGTQLTRLANQLKARPRDRGVEIGMRRVSSWKAGCTCALNLHATGPAHPAFRFAYIPATQPRNADNEDTLQDDAVSTDDSELQLPTRPLFVWTMFDSVSVYLCPSCLRSHLYDFAIKIPVRHVPLGFASVAAKDGPSTHNTPIIQITHSHSPIALASLQNGLGCTLLQHPTSQVLLTSPTPCQREFVCGACIGTAQVGASLVAPLEFIFKRSSLRSLRDMFDVILVTHKNMMTISGTHIQGLHSTQVRHHTQIDLLKCRV